MNSDEVFKQAVEYLEDGGELPSSVSNKFLAACLRQIHSNTTHNTTKIEENKDRILRLEVLLGFGGSGGLILLILKLAGVV
jgi:hypothetical protein